MSLTEFNAEEVYNDIRAEGIELGIAQGMQQGMQQGTQQKAVEDAIKIIKKYKATPEDAAKDVGIQLSLVLEALKTEL